MRSIANDRWEAEFAVEELGRYVYTIVAWVDAYGTWALDLAKRVKAGVDISVDALHGVKVAAGGRDQSQGVDKQETDLRRERLRELSREDPKMAAEFAQNSDLLELTARNRNFSQGVRYERELSVVVDPVRARFGAWYEMFPRSCTTDPKRQELFGLCRAPRLCCLDGL